MGQELNKLQSVPRVPSHAKLTIKVSFNQYYTHYLVLYRIFRNILNDISNLCEKKIITSQFHFPSKNLVSKLDASDEVVIDRVPG